MTRERTVTALWAAALLAAVAFSWTRLALEPFDVPHDDDYRAVRVALDSAGFSRGADGSGDALAILPPWSLRPLAVLGDLEPISGDALDTQPLQRYRRLFVVVEPDATAVADRLVARLGAPHETRTGRVRLWRFDVKEGRALFDLRAQIGAATIQLLGGAAPVVCSQPVGAVVAGVSCAGRPEWQRVTREWLMVSENADDAVWSHPPPPGERLQIAWPSVPIGAALVLRTGFTREGADRAHGTVRVGVEIDGERVATIERRPRFAFTSERIDTSRFLGRTARLALIIEADDNAAAHFAWDATLVTDP